MWFACVGHDLVGWRGGVGGGRRAEREEGSGARSMILSSIVMSHDDG